MKRNFVFSILVCITYISSGQAPILDFELQTLVPPVAGQPALVDPVDIAAAEDGSGRLFIVEKRGTVRIVKNDTVRAAFFLDVRPGGIYTGGECGLLGLAFHPNYPTSPYIYVYYMKGSGTQSMSRISRFTLNSGNPNDMLENTELVILEFNSHPGESNHKAGDLAFGPNGYLYIAVGDGGGGGDPGENGQDGQELLGKILRIDINNGSPYSIPANNPFVNNANVRDEIWAMGMRNPWRLSFDRETGDLWIGDVGQGAWEEIDFEPAGFAGGNNYGWDCYEASSATSDTAGCQGMSNYDFPLFAYPRNCNQGCPYGTGTCIIGGFVYRGQFPSMQGYYICADNGTERIWLIDGTDTTTTTMQLGGTMFDQLSSFGEDDNGELYAVSMLDNLYRIVPDGFLPIYLTRFDLIPREETVDLRWSLQNVADITSFTLERSTDGIYFRTIGTVAPEKDKFNYTFTDVAPESKINYYRLIYTLFDGGAQISEVRTVDRRHYNISSEVHTHVGGGLAVTLHGEVGESKVSTYASDGRFVGSQDIDEVTNEISGTQDLHDGVYIVVVKSGARTWVHKWLKHR